MSTSLVGRFMPKVLMVVLLWYLPGLLSAQVAFTLAGNYPMGSNSVNVAAGDVDNDGRRDLLVRNGVGTILVLTNAGNGQLGSNSFFLSTVFSVFTTADINADGYVDAIGSDGLFGTGHIFVYTNNGSGGFGSNAAYIVGSAPLMPVAADANNDGWLDVICPNQAGATLSVLTNNGSGGLATASTPTLAASAGPISVVPVDLNNDGKFELVCANNGVSIVSSTLSVLTNGGNGVFKLSYTPIVGNKPVSVAAMDVNGDGWVDVICANTTSKTLSVLTNNGLGILGSNATVNVGTQPTIAARQINGEGRADLICANFGSDSFYFFTNNGSGAFGSNATLIASRPINFLAEDMNGDGMVDLICVNDGLRPVGVYTSRSSVSVFIAVPKLSGIASISNLVLSWSAMWTNWTLIQSTNLAEDKWGNYSGLIGSDGTNKFVTNSVAQDGLFFRLAHP